MKPQDLLPRLVLAAAIVGGVAYVFTWDGATSEAVSTAVKGTGVGLLAVYCAMLARELDGWLIAVVMLLGMLGDVLLNAVGLTTGALAFLAGHVVAIILYRRNARAPLTPRTILATALFAAAVVAFAAWLPQDAAQAPGIGLYSAGLALMAATAWLSRFPRGLVGLGALLFLVSDLLIFARIGPLRGQPLVGYGVWGLYFAAQLMIALGVTRTLAQRG
ncbi:lysoplasmalogenase family protein [Phenylobacterium sp. VNQ135]|uniref:lysoplasmalogenase family protein n=1 Tax=Phenylobacterium sp. VNQ135 TaxID=3400922 RepID=UPI003C0991E5